MIFRDRVDAATQLAGKLQKYRGQNPLILAIPRGAIPLGEVLAKELEGELDVVLVHKIGAPGNPEYAIGAVSEKGDVVLGDQARDYGITESYISTKSKQQVEMLQVRRKLYSPYRASRNFHGRVVILVDDGIATGQTMVAAVHSVRAERPAKIVVAAPVASNTASFALKKLADEVVVLDAPSDFHAVGSYYEDFSEVTDDEVVEILAKDSR